MNESKSSKTNKITEFIRDDFKNIALKFIASGLLALLLILIFTTNGFVTHLILRSIDYNSHDYVYDLILLLEILTGMALLVGSKVYLISENYKFWKDNLNKETQELSGAEKGNIGDTDIGTVHDTSHPQNRDKRGKKEGDQAEIIIRGSRDE